MDLSVIDSKGLIREAFRIDGITAGECRTIFLDWALSVPPQLRAQDAITALLEAYGDAPSGHPMTQVLRSGLEASPDARRKGGRAARIAANQNANPDP